MPLLLDGWNYVPAGSVPPDKYGVNDYSEALGAGDISTSPGNPGVQRIFYCLHGVLPAFLDSLLGYATPVGASSTTISRALPDPHPIYSNMYAVEATATGKGQLGQYNLGFAKYPVAMVTVQYRSPTYEVKDDLSITNELDRFVTRQYSFAGEFITINSTGMRFVSNVGSDGKHLALTQPPARATMTIEMQYTWHMVPANPAVSPYVPPNMTNIINCYGRINSQAFDTAHMNCPAGTVLFLGVEPRMTNYRIATGALRDNVFWDITMKFLFRQNGFVSRGSSGTAISEYAGHNFIWDQGKQWWDLITTDGTNSGGRLYPTADLNTLFQIG